MYQLRGKPQDLSSHTFCCSRSTFQLQSDSKESFNTTKSGHTITVYGHMKHPNLSCDFLAIPRLWERHHGLQNVFHRSLKSIGLTSGEGRNGETLGRHELNPRHLWYPILVGLENACSNQIDHGWVSILARSNLWLQTSTTKSCCTSDIPNASHFAPHLDCMVLTTVR